MKKMSRRCKLMNAMYQFLLRHQGPIVDFTVSVRKMNPHDTCPDCVEIDQIFLHLSRKNPVKRLSLSCMYDLPLSVFSFPQLTDLYLYDCGINHTPTFNGFGSLTTLYLEYVYLYKKPLMHILSNNPLLKSFTMLTECATIVIDEDSTVVDLFECLPVIEDLTFCAWDLQSFSGEAVQRELPNPLVHLKYLGFKRMCFLQEDWLRLLVLLIRSSPNLEKLKLQMICEDTCNWYNDFYSMNDYSDIWLEQLIELEIEGFRNRTTELEFVKLILAKSPVLKKVRLMINDKDEVLKMQRILIPSTRVSPMVEIVGDFVEEMNIVECHG